MTYPTIMPAITLDFANSQQLDPRITFSRSSSATYINSAGLVVSAADHEARFDHDDNGECLGLLIEDSRTNLAEQSEDLNSWWRKLPVSITPNATQAPDGLSDADKLVSSNGTGRFGLYQWLTLTANLPYTFSCFAKADEWNFFTIAVGKQGSPYTRASYTIDLTTGDVNQGPWQNTPVFESFTKTKLSNGWWRLAVTVTVDSTSTDFQFEMGMSPTNQYNNGMVGDGTSGIYLWGAQIEEAFPTSYIPTTGSAVTRAADIAQITGTNFSSWYNQSEGTMQVTFNVINNSLGSERFLSAASSGSDSTTGYVYRATSLYAVQSNGANNWSSTGSWLSTGIIPGNNNFAFGYSPGSNATVRDGVIQETNTETVLVEQSSTTLYMLNQISGHISRISYYNQRLTDAELQTLTS